MNTGPESGRVQGRWPEAALAALIGTAMTSWLFYPGLMSLDSAVQYAQALHVWPPDDVHPPLMSLLWRLCDRVIVGPGGLFLLFALGWWGGLAALCWQLDLPRWRRWILVFVVGLWPATLLMLAHLWKDVGMTVALLLASAATLAWRRRHAPLLRGAALTLLVLAACFRHNGLFAALPIMAWLCWPLPGQQARPLRRALVGVALVAVLALAPGLLLRVTGAARVQPWSVVVLWDLAAMSIDADQVLLPDSVTTPELSVAELREAYKPWANPPLFDLGRIQLSFHQPYNQAQVRDVLRAWRDAVRRDPRAYLKHRARLSRYLLWGFPSDLPRELVYVPQRVVLAGVALAVTPVDESALPWRAASRLRSTPLFAGGVYLALALFASAIAWRTARTSERQLVGVLSLSAWANALPLFVLSGSAEFRYLTWTALAALLAFGIAVSGRRRDIG